MLAKKAKGGNTYDFYAIRALRSVFDVNMDPVTVRRSGDSKYHHALRLLRNRGVADLVIKEACMVALSPVRIAPVQFGIIHHIDEERMEKSMKHRWYFSRLMKRLPRMDVVVTVSSYWKKKLQNIGCKNVEIIYNSFDLQDFDVSDDEVNAFLQREGIPRDKKILYIGGASARKGAKEVYDVLKDQGYYMVVTGPKKEIDLPVRWFNLERRDYLCLLKACSLVLTMSTLLEGWNRVAHEAMLSGTPVIGSGIGGMEELLQGGQQQIVRDMSQLQPAVKNALKNQEAFAQRGRTYARQFNMDYFTREWIRVTRTYTASAHQELATMAQSA